MPRYQPATGPEAELEPGSRGRVLRNLAGITSKREPDGSLPILPHRGNGSKTV